MHIKPRWMLPMTGDRTLLENHTLVVRDGRILDVLPAMPRPSAMRRACCSSDPRTS